MRSKAKDTEVSEFGEEKGLLRGARIWVACAPKALDLFKGFQQSTFKGKMRGGGCGPLLQTSGCRNPLFLQLSV